MSFTLERIRDFWTDQAKTHGQSYAASWSDRYAIELEIETLLNYVAPGDRMLDIGCANGFSTLRIVSQRAVSVDAIDYIPDMVEQATRRAADLDGQLQGSVRFSVGDATALEQESESYDKVMAIRVVINLRSWDNQKKALQEASRVLKRGGLLLLSEATLQGWTKLNSLRATFGLAPIPMPAFNEYLDQDRVVDALRGSMDLVMIRNFSSTYFLGTRVLKPLVFPIVGLAAEIPNPQTAWNRWFSRLPALGTFGTQKLFVFRKK